jgi:hypothetical protein
VIELLTDVLSHSDPTMLQLAIALWTQVWFTAYPFIEADGKEGQFAGAVHALTAKRLAQQPDIAGLADVYQVSQAEIKGLMEWMDAVFAG